MATVKELEEQIKLKQQKTYKLQVEIEDLEQQKEIALAEERAASIKEDILILTAASLLEEYFPDEFYEYQNEECRSSNKEKDETDREMRIRYLMRHGIEVDVKDGIILIDHVWSDVVRNSICLSMTLTI